MLSKRTKEHSFSVEIISEHCVKRLSLQDRNGGFVLFEGFLGKLNSVCMVEDLMLQIEGANGVLRIDISRKELEACLRANKTPSEEGEQR
jgi:hypothetical protein